MLLPALTHIDGLTCKQYLEYFEKQQTLTGLCTLILYYHILEMEDLDVDE